ncbi:succinate dehydrogenase, cytochrome b556 subunit [Wenzhouxiangella sp. AB-CW3]|uniref:succinate dehydrogenase, cytochrome b556 subunit n=1 Tax=Wenzhouxiangella sp. AB-CW3 TaxID=2771012 RepID=UPI00168BB435|nr:succinate dehydrogenase, cytochrome b556 subunit [Wenzhouxiangella sp. AB-CW3]QOC21100.1 succinate dehydrogenase, cytochrome b556 subunit [Wenzhouxiangella sp. AB-CW3]
MVTDNRPISPYTVYRPQLTSVMSFSHRISGILLSLGMVVVVLWVLALASGPEAFERINSLLATPIGLVAMLVWTFSLFYHLLNGIRHLLWDAGWLLDLRGAYASGWIVLIASVVMTAVVWGGLL